MKINGYFVIATVFLNLFLFPSICIKVSYKLSYIAIWKAESSFTGFGTLFYQSKSQIQYKDIS